MATTRTQFEDAFKSGLEAHPNGPIFSVLDVALTELKVDHEPSFWGENKARPKVHNLGTLGSGQVTFSVSDIVDVTVALATDSVNVTISHHAYPRSQQEMTVHHDIFLDELNRLVENYLTSCKNQLVSTMLYTPECITHEGQVFTDANINGTYFKTVGLMLGNPEATVEKLKPHLRASWAKDEAFLDKLTRSVGDAMDLLPIELPVDTNNLSAKGRLVFAESFVAFKSKRSKYWNRPNKISSKNMPELRPMLIGVFTADEDVYIGRVGEGDGKYFLMEPVKNSSGWKSYTPQVEDGKPIILKDDSFVDNLMQKAIDKAKDPIKDAHERKRGR